MFVCVCMRTFPTLSCTSLLPAACAFPAFLVLLAKTRLLHTQDYVSIKLVDTHDHILSTYDRQIAIYATEQFTRQGIDLVLNCRVSLLPRAAAMPVPVMQSPWVWTAKQRVISGAAVALLAGLAPGCGWSGEVTGS